MNQISTMKSWSVLFFAIAIAISTTVSCSDELNFDQADSLTVVPTLATSLLYIESDEGSINLAGTGSFYSQTFTFEAFNEPFVAENVLDGIITYQIVNTTSKELDILVEFLDEEGNVLDAELFNSSAEPAPLLERQVAYGNGGRNLDILRNTTNIRVNGVNMGDATSISSQSNPRLILKSSAVFRLRLL